MYYAIIILIFILLSISGSACRIQWTRIRDNHRKAMNLRKTKSGQASSKMKPPKYHLELQFLTPYLNDSEHRMSNIAPSPGYLEDEESDGEPEPTFAVPVPTPSPATSDAQSLCSNSSTHGKRKKTSGSSTPQHTTALVLEKYLKSKELKSPSQSDTLTNFFVNMAQTVKTFPLQDQIYIKGQLFQMVNGTEMRLLQERDQNNRVHPIDVLQQNATSEEDATQHSIMQLL